MSLAPDSADFSEIMLFDNPYAATDGQPVADAVIGPRLDSVRPLPFDSILDTARIENYVDKLVLQVPDTATAATMTPPDTWNNGLAPRPRTISPAADSGFLLTLAVLLLIAAFNIRHLGHIITTAVNELVKVRRGRDNIFDERSASDTGIRIFLIFLFIASAGVFMSIGALDLSGSGTRLSISDVLKYSCLCAVYCGVMYVAYLTVGYTFATAEGRREWLRGYTASLILAGVILALPSVAALFYPILAIKLAISALIVFILGRLLFIIKGFRIFYDKISDLVYFILYLCTLEIIPLLMVYHLALHELQ